LYVQPLYLAAENGGVPELKRVLVSYGNNIAMEETLEKSLNAIFGGTTQAKQAEMSTSPASATAPQETTVKKMIQDANQQFEKAQQELAKKNWAGYGAAMNEVQRILQEMGMKVK
jgi:uncharacterized membrane protein (UPF0182 family)